VFISLMAIGWSRGFSIRGNTRALNTSTKQMQIAYAISGERQTYGQMDGLTALCQNDLESHDIQLLGSFPHDVPGWWPTLP
jgi:hypothetical protein